MSDKDQPAASGLNRRHLLRATAGIAATAGAAGAAVAQAPAQLKNAQAGRTFRAWISKGTGPDRTRLQDVRLRAVEGRNVVVRTEATNLCYTNCPMVLGLPGRAAWASPFDDMALIQGHGGVGVVEAVGPDVRRCRVGDRVIVSGTPQCGSCYQCLRGRADMCQFIARQGPGDLSPIANTGSGEPVYANSHIGGLAELMVSPEEWIVPIQSEAPAAELGLLGCVGVAGLGATTAHPVARLEPASSVVVLGCGPIGLSAVQGARIAGASTIIAVEPIKARRDMALQVGATHVIDPNEAGEELVERVRTLTGGPHDRLWAGGREAGGLLGGAGADFVVEAVGGDHVPPKATAGPDPTGVLPVEQGYVMTAPGGHFVTTGLPTANITIPAAFFMFGSRSQHGGQAGGANPMRDIPRFVDMLNTGAYDAKPLATSVVGIEDMKAAYEEVLYRTTITGIMVC